MSTEVLQGSGALLQALQDDQDLVLFRSEHSIQERHPETKEVLYQLPTRLKGRGQAQHKPQTHDREDNSPSEQLRGRVSSLLSEQIEKKILKVLHCGSTPT